MIEIQFLINFIGMVIIDVGAFAYTQIYDTSKIIALIMLMLGNGIGGVLYKYTRLYNFINDTLVADRKSVV